MRQVLESTRGRRYSASHQQHLQSVFVVSLFGFFGGKMKVSAVQRQCYFRVSVGATAPFIVGVPASAASS